MGVAQKNLATAHANGKRSASIPPTAVAFLEAPIRTMLPMVSGRLFVFFTLNGLPRFAQPAVQLKQAYICNTLVVKNADGKVFDSLDSINSSEVGLLLGTTPQTR